MLSFVRNGKPEQVDAFWRVAAENMIEALTVKSATHASWWFSTNGYDITWVHVRIDMTPKHFNYDPYKMIEV